MGNLFGCPACTGYKRSGSTNSRQKLFQQLDSEIKEQILAAAVLYQQQQQNGAGTGLNMSASTRPPEMKKVPLPRSASERPPCANDPVVQPQQLVQQESKVDELKRKHLVIVDGCGFGAWCWYKTRALLEEAGFRVTTLSVSGADSYDPNTITTITQHMQPVTEFFENLPEDDKVILVGHGLGCIVLSCAMELFASKISKAVFMAAVMLTDGQSALDLFLNQAYLMQESDTLVYDNGNNNLPTAIDFNKLLMKNVMLNRIAEKLSLTDTNYGSVRRFYIETQEDNCIPISVQESMVNSSPPERVFHIKGSDHCPQALHNILVRIAKLD
uniref:AB hydrolase-1 domain-containing protein n=1 Tax=Kalanchoe fedtschenkoi TaxID=63787 RepID=A0A7N0V115_KALFE